MSEQSCRSCKYLHVPPNKAGHRVTQKDRSYMCTWAPPKIPLADSITTFYMYQEGHNKRYMEPSDGKKCPTYEKRK